MALSIAFAALFTGLWTGKDYWLNDGRLERSTAQIRNRYRDSDRMGSRSGASRSPAPTTSLRRCTRRSTSAWHSSSSTPNALNAAIFLHAGQVLFGPIGNAERVDFTVIGSAVNIASRIEALTKKLGVDLIISAAVAAVAARAGSAIDLEELGIERIRGTTAEMTVFAVKGALTPVAVDDRRSA